MKEVLTLVILLTMTSACTPRAVVMKLMAPVRQDGVMTLGDAWKEMDADKRGPAVSNMHNMVMVAAEDLVIAVTMYELKELFWAQFDVYNTSDDDYIINSDDYLLLDRYRTVLRKVAPDEAANIFLSKISGIPPFTYTPKYYYSATSNTYGYLASSGHFYANTQTTGQIYEDEWNRAGAALGYALGATIVASQNKKLQQMAGVVYQFGLVQNSEIPAKTGARGGIYWLRPKHYASPLILRVLSTGKEYQFKLSSK